MTYSSYGYYMKYQYGKITSEIPDDYYCDNVTLWKYYDLTSYFTDYKTAILYGMFESSVNGGEYELCSTVRKWENSLKLECESVLCDYNANIEYLPKYLNDVTNGETSIFDWLNYCKYCKAGNSSYDCNPKDTYTRLLVSNFPTSALYCGSLEFGIPFAVNTSMVSYLLKQSIHFDVGNDFNYICYCVDNYDGYFAMKCSNNRSNYLVLRLISYCVIIIYGFSIIGTVLFTVIPKLQTTFMKKKYHIIIPSLTGLIGECIIFSNLILIENIGAIYIIVILDYIGLAFCAISLYSWLLNWLRLVLYLKNGQYPTYFKWIHLMIIFICLAVAVGAILSSMFTYFAYIFALVYASLAFVTLMAFVALIIFVFSTLKKISDVNLFKSSLVYYLIFISVFVVVAPVTKVLEEAFIFINLSNSLRYVLLFMLFNSVLYMDSDRKEVSHVYKSIWSTLKCSNSKKPKRKTRMFSSFIETSEPFLNAEIVNSSLTAITTTTSDVTTMHELSDSDRKY